MHIIFDVCAELVINLESIQKGSYTMSYDEYMCEYYGENCTSYKNWVGHDSVLTWVVNILILLAVLGLVAWLAWYFLAYRRRPFCSDCLEQDERVRAKYSFDDQPVCGGHWDQRDMASEEVYSCPKHHVELLKEKHGAVTIDICPSGCVFLDDGELDSIKSSARQSGASSGQFIGVAIGMAVG
jgi:hypothetical protein